MSIRKIKLNAVSDVMDFVNAAEKCDFDVDVYYNRFIIDAKSLMGVMSMDLHNILTVEYNSDPDPRFDSVLERFSVC